MNELTKKTTLLGTGLIIGAAAFTVIGASAHPGDGDGNRNGRGQTVSEVLGVTLDELKEAKDSGQTLEEIVTENGFESLESFESAMEDALRTKLSERGFTDEAIEEKIAAMQVRHEIKDDVSEARQTLLNLTREQVGEKKDAGMTFEEILAEAGYDSKDAFHDALTDSLGQTWADEGVDQETIDERLEQLEKRGQKRQHRAEHKRMGGFGS